MYACRCVEILLYMSNFYYACVYVITYTQKIIKMVKITYIFIEICYFYQNLC